MGHVIICGGKGCGKSERARKLLGMTHEEYEKHGKFIEKLLEEERKHRELMENCYRRSLVDLKLLTKVLGIDVKETHFVQPRNGMFLKAPLKCIERYQKMMDAQNVIIYDDAGKGLK